MASKDYTGRLSDGSVVSATLDVPDGGFQSNDDVDKAFQAQVSAGNYRPISEPKYQPPATNPGVLGKLQEAGATIGKAYKDYVADPLTAAVRYPFDLAGKLDVASGIKTQEQADSRAGTFSKLLVPQNLTEAGIMLGSLGAGPIAGKIGGMALADGASPLVSKLAAAGTRVVGAGVGGGVGSAIESGDFATGAEKGALAGVVGEGVGLAANRILRGGSKSASQKVQNFDANNVGTVLEGTPELGRVTVDPQTGAVTHGEPIFAGANTPVAIRNLVEGGQGQSILSQEYRRGLDMIDKAVGPPSQASRVIFRSPEAAGLAPLTQEEVRQTLVRGGVIPEGGTLAPRTYTDGLAPTDPGKFVPFSQAKIELDQLRRAAAVPQITPEAVQAQQKYAQALANFADDLSRVDPTGAARGIFDGMQRQYQKGLALIETLAPAFQGNSASDRINFNTPKVQQALKAGEGALRKLLGNDTFEQLATAARAINPRGATQPGITPAGLVDQAAKPGILSMPPFRYGGGALVDRMVPPAPQYTQGPWSGGYPFQLGPAARTGINVAVGRDQAANGDQTGGLGYSGLATFGAALKAAEAAKKAGGRLGHFAFGE